MAELSPPRHAARAEATHLSPTGRDDPNRLLALLLSDGPLIPRQRAHRTHMPLRHHANRERLVEWGKWMFRGRQLRHKRFTTSLFGEPCWDMLLGLYVTDQAEGLNSIRQLAQLTGSPVNVLLGCLDDLVDEGLVAKYAMPENHAIKIALSDSGREILDAYFQDLMGSD